MVLSGVTVWRGAGEFDQGLPFPESAGAPLTPGEAVLRFPHSLGVSGVEGIQERPLGAVDFLGRALPIWRQSKRLVVIRAGLGRLHQAARPS